MFAAPSALPLLHIHPRYIADNLFGIIDTSADDVIFTIYAGGVAFPVFYHRASELQNFPVVFGGVE